MTLPGPLPTDLAAAHAMILAQREMLAEVRSEAKVCAIEIERLKLSAASNSSSAGRGRGQGRDRRS